MITEESLKAYRAKGKLIRIKLLFLLLSLNLGFGKRELNQTLAELS